MATAAAVGRVAYGGVRIGNAKIALLGHLPALPLRASTLHADLQPTFEAVSNGEECKKRDENEPGKPVESNGPLSKAGPEVNYGIILCILRRHAQFGPRSTGQEGIPQPTLLSIRILEF